MSITEGSQMTEFVEQTAWYEGWCKTPLWLRLLGAPKQYYRDSPRDRTHRMCWGELTFRWTGVSLEVGGYETAHFHVALLFFSAFIRLPFLDKAICDAGPCGMENPRFGFSIHGTDLSGVHLNWGRRSKIISYPWQPWYGLHEYLDHAGEWRPKLYGMDPGAEAPKLALELPYHYLLDSGEVQHVTATVTRERTYPTWQWFGTSGRIRKAPVSDALRRLQMRFVRPKQYIDITFSGEVGERAGSWKGGCIGCSYEMRPGETPQHTLRRMQRERRFR